MIKNLTSNYLSNKNKTKQNKKESHAYIVVAPNIFGCGVKNKVSPKWKCLLVQWCGKCTINTHQCSMSMTHLWNKFNINASQKWICWGFSEEKRNLHGRRIQVTSTSTNKTKHSILKTLKRRKLGRWSHIVPFQSYFKGVHICRINGGSLHSKF